MYGIQDLKLITLLLALVKLSGQTYFCSDKTRFWPDNYYIYYDACISIILNFWSVRSVKDWTKSPVIQRFYRTKLLFDRTLFIDWLLNFKP